MRYLPSNIGNGHPEVDGKTGYGLLDFYLFNYYLKPSEQFALAFGSPLPAIQKFPLWLEGGVMLIHSDVAVETAGENPGIYKHTHIHFPVYLTTYF